LPQSCSCDQSQQAARDIGEAFAAGFSSRLTKPIEVNEFMKIFDVVSSGSQLAWGHAAIKENS